MSENDDPADVSRPCRLFGILARECPVGVLFRRGPSKWVRLVKWNTEDDSFESGQWFHGRVYERRCDLSPDGRLLIYFASKFTSKTLADQPSAAERLKAWLTGNSKERDGHYTHAWTAVSKPPWFSALALWPKGDCYHGGGLFEDNRTVWLNHSDFQARPHPNHRPVGLTVHPNPHAQGEDEPIYSKRLVRDGWISEQQGRFSPIRGRGWKTEQTEVLRKRSPCEVYDLLMVLNAIDFDVYGGPYVLTFCLRPTSGGDLLDLGEATWADWDRRGRLLLAKDGRLFHYELMKNHDFVPRLIRDFNDDKPKSIESPPEAVAWD